MTQELHNPNLYQGEKEKADILSQGYPPFPAETIDGAEEGGAVKSKGEKIRLLLRKMPE